MTQNKMVQPVTRRHQQVRKELDKKEDCENTEETGDFIHQPIQNGNNARRRNSRSKNFHAYSAVSHKFNFDSCDYASMPSLSMFSTMQQYRTMQ
jgi:hypothetical protein